MATADWVEAEASRSCSRARCPPAMCPASCASTPMTWLGVSRVQQRAGIDEYAATVRNESIERAVIDNDDLDILPSEPGDPQDRLGIFFEQLLDFRVANDRRTLSRLGRQACTRKRSRGQEGGHARCYASSCWCRSAHPATSL